MLFNCYKGEGVPFEFRPQGLEEFFDDKNIYELVVNGDYDGIYKKYIDFLKDKKMAYSKALAVYLANKQLVEAGEKTERIPHPYTFYTANVITIRLNRGELHRDIMDELKGLIKYFDEKGFTVNIILFKNIHDQLPNSKVNYYYNVFNIELLDELDRQLNNAKHRGALRFMEIYPPINIRMDDEERKGRARVPGIFSYEEGLNRMWTLDDIKLIYRELEKITTTITNNHYSELEAMAYIHYYAVHNFRKQDIGLEESRTLIGLLKHKLGLQAGFATFIKAAVDKLKYSRLSCDYVCISYYDTEGNPQQALVNKITLCDYKYQTNHIPVSGTFIEDSFSDAKSSSNESLYDINKNAVSFAHFLMPFDMALWQSVYVNSDTVPSYAVPYRRLYALYGIFQNYEGSAQFIYDEFSKWGEPKKIPYTIMRYLFTNMMASLCDEFGLSDVEYLRGIVDGTKFTRNFVDANNPTWLLLFEDAVNYYLRAIKNTNSDDNRGDGK